MGDHSNDNGRERRDAEGIIPSFGPAKLDVHGHLLPIGTEERQARADAVRRLFALWETETDDDPPGTAEEFLRNMDEERARLGMRTLFEEYR